MGIMEGEDESCSRGKNARGSVKGETAEINHNNLISPHLAHHNNNRFHQLQNIPGYM
jgi:hypothetical protein